MSASPTLIRILAVDDHPLLRSGIATLVNAEPDMKLIAEASNGQEGLEQFRLHRPDVTLMDLQMPDFNGVDVIERIRREFDDARIIVLTTYTGDVQVLRALQAGGQTLHLEGARPPRTSRDHSCGPRRTETDTARDRSGPGRACSG